MSPQAEHDESGRLHPAPKLPFPSFFAGQLTDPEQGRHGDAHSSNGRGFGSRRGAAVALLAAAVLAALAACVSLPRRVARESSELPYCTPDDLQGLLANGSVHWRSPVRPPPRGSAGLWRAPTPPPAHPQLYLDRCSLRRFTAPEARRCLAAKPLVMIGDSVTRYQFLSLINWLDSGRWPPPEHGDPERGHPSPVIESEWTHGWPDFFRGTTLPFDGRQQCHCFRQDWDIREDRFYTLPGSSRVNAAFWMWMGYPLKPVIGRWGFPPFSNASACAPGECGGDPDWSMPLEEALRQVMSRLQPATVVLNSGLWRSPGDKPWPPRVYDAIMAAARDAVAAQGGACIWKTTTFARDGRIPRGWDDRAVAHAARHGWRVMDAWALTRPAAQLDPPAYWDDLHFVGYPYEEMNHFLLNMIC